MTMGQTDGLLRVSSGFWQRSAPARNRASGSGRSPAATLSTMRSIRWLVYLWTFTLLVVLGACTRRFIPNTDVEDTSENRRVVQFAEEYRRAVERRNIELLMDLTHPEYHEDGGNIDGSDDIDRKGLREYLEEQFARTRAIRYEIRYRRVGKGRDNRVFVDYTYSASYKVPTPKGDIWRRVVADNRLELVPSGESFKIISGM